MKNEHDLAYDRQCRENDAKELARHLSIQYDKVLAYLEQHDTEGANKLKANNEIMNFKDLINKEITSLTDSELTQFLRTVGNYSRQFRETTTKIATEQFADRSK